MDEINEKIQKLDQIVKHSRRIVFFGGAGVSTESGIPDFRSQDGLYSLTYAYPPEVILSHSFFHSHTAEFYRFYKDKMIYREAKPNAAHIFLAKAESAGKLTAVVTQNIDNLHQAAGSKRVCELHGSIYRNYCLDCGKSFSLDYIANSQGIPRCSCGGIIKPDVVLYDEGLDDTVWQEASKHIARCDTLIVGGTSLSVYPAAYLINLFRGENLVLINKSVTPFDNRATLLIEGKIGQILGALSPF